MLETLEVSHRVDVVREVGKRDGPRNRGEARGAAGAVERLEVGRRREAESVRRPVGSRHQRRSGSGKRLEIGRSDAREVGVDDDHRALHTGELGRDRDSLTAAEVGDPRRADSATRGEHVLEHRGRERAAHLGRRVQTRLSFPARKRDNECDHSGKPTQGGDTYAVQIVATTKLFGPAWDELAAVDVLETWPPPTPMPGVDVLVAVVARVGAAELDLLPDLRLVANYGVGYDLVDVEECRRRGVAVTNTPGVLDAAVADLTLALILATRRNIVTADRWIREGGWQNNWARPKLLGRDLAGSRLGLVGFGRIGQQVARRAEVFGMEVAFHTRNAGVALDELLSASDVVSLHTPLTEETQGLLSRERLALIQDGATLINTARGAVVDENALVAELVSGRISAGLDVFADEPRVPDALLDLPNVVLTPHIASATLETRAAMTRVLVDTVVAYGRGEPLVTPVTVS